MENGLGMFVFFFFSQSYLLELLLGLVYVVC